MTIRSRVTLSLCARYFKAARLVVLTDPRRQQLVESLRDSPVQFSLARVAHTQRPLLKLDAKTSLIVREPSTPAGVGQLVAASSLAPKSSAAASDVNHRKINVMTIPVELIGIEPTTSGLQSPRSPS